MTEIDEITSAVRGVLGEMTSPETAHRLAKALRPIHGREAADEVARYGRIATKEASDSDVGPMGSIVGLAHSRAAEHLSSFILRVFGVSNA